jgi:hypothetical protein
MVKLNDEPQHPITRDTPLPGFYPCLTLQLNLTRYQSGRLARMVLVVREPSSSLEVHRAFRDLGEWEATVLDTQMAVREALTSMAWMQDGLNR